MSRMFFKTNQHLIFIQCQIFTSFLFILFLTTFTNSTLLIQFLYSLFTFGTLFFISCFIFSVVITYNLFLFGFYFCLDFPFSFTIITFTLNLTSFLMKFG